MNSPGRPHSRCLLVRRWHLLQKHPPPAMRLLRCLQQLECPPREGCNEDPKSSYRLLHHSEWYNGLISACCAEVQLISLLGILVEARTAFEEASPCLEAVVEGGFACVRSPSKGGQAGEHCNRLRTQPSPHPSCRSKPKCVLRPCRSEG